MAPGVSAGVAPCGPNTAPCQPSLRGPRAMPRALILCECPMHSTRGGAHGPGSHTPPHVRVCRHLPPRLALLQRPARCTHGIGTRLPTSLTGGVPHFRPEYGFGRGDSLGVAIYQYLTRGCRRTLPSFSVAFSCQSEHMNTDRRPCPPVVPLSQPAYSVCPQGVLK
jgi:hypothetical protein